MAHRIRPCPVCGLNLAHRLQSNTMAALDGLDMSYALARCKACGFHFAQELPDESQYLQYYDRLSKYDSQPSVSAIDRERIAAAVAFLERIAIPKDARVVDLGCGFGAFLAALSDSGWLNLRGIDPAPRSAQAALEQFGLEGITRGTLAEAGRVMDLRCADLVCLMAVLEHLPELRRDLAALISQLRPGAHILVEVPALDLFSPDAGEPFGELSIEHIQFFSMQSLRNLLSTLGAQVIAEELVLLPSLHSGALFVLAEVVGGSASAVVREDPAHIDAYLAGSAQRWEAALRRVPSEQFVLYGAGSHSARLLPRLTDQQRVNLIAVVDGNQNLCGKSFGSWTIEHPDVLTRHPGLPVLVSSYRAEQAISEMLEDRFHSNPVQRMYN